MIRIIGITGTLGAGKGTVVSCLVRDWGYRHFSVREFLLEEIRFRSLPENRDSMVTVANDLRKRHSPSYIIDCLYERAAAQSGPSVIESIRTPGEVTSLRQKGAFLLLAVDADPVIRYRRILLRNSETDLVTFETFTQNEIREMESPDPFRQNIRKCIDMADYLIMNNGTVAGLNRKIGDWLKQHADSGDEKKR
ncbi:MAG: AAA family ATPase [Bacteroidales bacterium]|nr:AAA family ATPase [Bacteroidales bacterium]